jgi:crotonobetainyl-CoA:carnitine CoA-transferase CaiB-like acyl-CoA transferase
MLSSIKILDLTRVLAGPLCTMILGDLGADVLKVERPGVGDDTRGWGPPFDEQGRSAYFLSINRNKLALAADFDSAADREVLDHLVAEADVVVDNFRRGTLERRGFSPNEWCAKRPELVWCTISGFGPESDRPGYDFVTQAESGWMAITGTPEGDPMKVGVALADILAGKDAAIAILSALVSRFQSGRGARLHISLLDSARAALVNVAQNSILTGRDAKRWGNAHPNLVPYQLFKALDRAIVVAVGSDAQWVACARALGLDELAGDAALARNAGRLAQRERIVSEFSRRIATRSAAEWSELLDVAGVPNGVVLSVLEALRNADASPITGMKSSVGGVVRFPPPGLDQHGEIVRREGWGAFASVSAVDRWTGGPVDRTDT